MASTQAPGSRARLVLVGLVVIVALIGASLLLDDDTSSTRGGGTTSGFAPIEAAPTVEIDPAMVRPPAQPEPLHGEQPLEPELDADSFAGLAEGEASIVGIVVDALDRPVPGMDVGLYDDAGDYLDSSVTDDEGHFALSWGDPLLAGFSVITEPDALADPDDPDTVAPASYEHPTDLLPGDPAVVVRLKVAPAPWLSGIVFDVDGLPAEVAQLELVSLGSAWTDAYIDDYTEPDGTFSFSVHEMPTDQLLLRASDLAGEGVAMLGPFAMQPGERPFLELHLTLPGTLRGSVIDARDGLGVDGAEVKVLALHDQFDGGDAWDLTWDEGQFELEFVEAPPGQLWLHVLPDDHGPALVQVTDMRRKVEVRVGPVPRLSGTVHVAETDEPVSDCQVRLQLLGPAGTYGEEDAELADDKGRFAIDLVTVPPEHGLLIVEADGYVTFKQRLSELIPIPLLAGELTCDITLQPLPGH